MACHCVALTCSSPCSPISPAEKAGERQKKNPQCLALCSTGNVGWRAESRRGPGLNSVLPLLGLLSDRQLADVSQLCVKGLPVNAERREVWDWQTSADGQVNY